MTEYARDLSDHRLNKARDTLRQAELLLNNNEYDGSINRSYYAIFHAIRSLLALIGVDSRKHTDDAVRFIQEIEDKRAQLIQGTIPLPQIT